VLSILFFSCLFDLFVLQFFVLFFQDPPTIALTDYVNRVPTLLAGNPYCQLVTYPSVPTSSFYLDSQKSIVNKYQKPLCLMLQLLQMFAAPGSLVIDATCGSGSLEIAALEPEAPNDLKFISFEKNDYQMKYAKERLANVCGSVDSTKPNEIPLDCRFEKYGC